MFNLRQSDVPKIFECQFRTLAHGAASPFNVEPAKDVELKVIFETAFKSGPGVQNTKTKFENLMSLK
jgi:hypothetical protein